jgi:hypothetical protein
MMRAAATLTREWGVRTFASLNPIMVDGTGMCGGCRIAVGGKVRFARIDGPEFDAHEVDFDEVARATGHTWNKSAWFSNATLEPLPGVRLRYQAGAADRPCGRQNLRYLLWGISSHSIILLSGIIKPGSWRPAWICRSGVPQQTQAQSWYHIARMFETRESAGAAAICRTQL